MAQVWVQVWTAQVAGSVQVEESVLRQVVSDFQKLIPMVVQVEERVQDLVSAEEKVEVLEPMELVSESEKAQLVREKALSKGWGWVLREQE
jgi:hypothetical protein